MESPLMPISDDNEWKPPASAINTAVGGCLKITSFWGTLMAKDVGHNEIDPLSTEKYFYRMENRWYRLKPTKRQKKIHCAQQVWTTAT